MNSVGFVLPFIKVILALAVIIFVVGKLQGKYYFLQYAYFLRVPIGAALLMLILPIVVLLEPVKQFASNWFDLDFFGLAVVTFLSLLLAWVVMNKFFVNFYLTAPRNHLVLIRKRQEEAKRLGKYDNIEYPFLNRHLGPFTVRFCLFSLLAIPVVVVSFHYSSLGGITQLSAIAIGFSCAVFLWAIWQIWVQQQLLTFLQRKLGGRRRKVWHKLRSWLVFCTSDEFADALVQGYDRQPPHVERVRISAWLFFIITYGTYLVAYFLLKPDDFPEWTERVPALGYILLFLILLVWLLPTITLFLDKFRIPTLTTILFVSFIVTRFFGSDYFYELAEPNDQTVAEFVPTAADSYMKWQEKHSDRNRAIIITASGGGISAAYWTSLVIAELERALHPTFSSSVLLISSTSGGSVGAMHTVAQYGPEGLDLSRLDEIIEDAGSSSLGAAAWGIIFPDLWRSIFGYSPLADRAWAQEQIWQHYMQQGGSDTAITMGSWRRGIMEGWRPVVVFNATIAETGEQLFISPINLAEKDPRSGKCSDEPGKEDYPQTRDMMDLYPGSDIKIATAARLSAAFPIITPTARPKFTTDCKWVAFHIGDGGYYDNYGTQAAIRYLQQVLPIARNQLKKVLVIQIRASGRKIKLKARSTTSTVGDVLAPLVTMFNVRGTSQVLNNDLMFELQKLRWSEMPENPVSIEPLVIPLGQDSPLSWYLSTKDKCRILTRWNEMRAAKTKSVADFLQIPISSELPPLQLPEGCKIS